MKTLRNYPNWLRICLVTLQSDHMLNKLCQPVCIKLEINDNKYALSVIHPLQVHSHYWSHRLLVPPRRFNPTTGPTRNFRQTDELL